MIFFVDVENYMNNCLRLEYLPLRSMSYNAKEWKN